MNALPSNPAADEIPTFAIVGHPNKGKSSLVATLAHDSDVQISAQSGTTEFNQTFPMSVDGEVLYQLTDTPGFQRARQVWDWLQKNSSSVADRAQTVRNFVEQHRDNTLFTAECELLRPLTEGAGILYVVDGSVPYGNEYDAEMEILRWTGQPSMALINQIHDSDFHEEWESALSQYFRIVRRFNAQLADFDRQLGLLSGFSELNENWRDRLLTAVNLLRRRREGQRTASAMVIAELIHQAMTCQIDTELPDQENDSDSVAKTLRQELQNSIVQMESNARQDIERLYHFDRLDAEEDTLSLDHNQLFSATSWEMFGLAKDQLLVAGAVGGAATGGIVDIATGGGSLMLGTGIGAIVGGVSAFLSEQKMFQSTLRKTGLGNDRLTVGPIESVNFPYVLLGRALNHVSVIEGRTHARQDVLRIQGEESRKWQQLSSMVKPLGALFADIKKQKLSRAESGRQLSTLILEILKNERSGSGE
ncbi:MAG: GTPase/DUF3482 domain-containing protein [Pseudomonadota bacterium]